MNRNSLLFILIILLSVSFWLSVRFVLDNKPELLSKLEKKQTELNEQYISAKILAEKLDQVYTLFSENLALSIQDSIAEDSSIPFLKNTLMASMFYSSILYFIYDFVLKGNLIRKKK